MGSILLPPILAYNRAWFSLRIITIKPYYELAKEKDFGNRAGGFIGSHMAERLVELGAWMRALVGYNAWNDQDLLELVTASMKK